MSKPHMLQFRISSESDANPFTEFELHRWLNDFDARDAERVCRWAMHAAPGESVMVGRIVVTAEQPQAEKAGRA